MECGGIEKSAVAFAPLHRSGRFYACSAADIRERFAAYFSSSNGVVPWQQNLYLCHQPLSKRIFDR